MGRPATKPVKFKDGFYLEVKNKGSRNGIKIRRSTKQEMLMAVKEYEKVKDVTVLGEFKNGKHVAEKKKA